MCIFKMNQLTTINVKFTVYVMVSFFLVQATGAKKIANYLDFSCWNLIKSDVVISDVLRSKYLSGVSSICLLCCGFFVPKKKLTLLCL